VVWVDTVKRGDFTRQVRGSGTLVPEDIRWIPAQTQGRVERIVLRPGAQVTAETVILDLSNPELEQSVREAMLGYQSAQAAFTNKKAELQSALLSQEANTANIETQYKQRALDLEANEQLAKDGLVSDLQLKQKRGLAEDLKNRLSVEQRRLAITREGINSQLARRSRREPEEGRLGSSPSAARGSQGEGGHGGHPAARAVEVGAQVKAGDNLARVANPSNLKAELRIAETRRRHSHQPVRRGRHSQRSRQGTCLTHRSRGAGWHRRRGRDHGW
jgi:HlyD family secretion protein